MGPVALCAMSPGDPTRQPPLGLSRCAALFHARVQPFFTPFAWTVGPSHRLATARARVVLPRECWLTARSRGEKQMAKIVRFHHVGGPEVLHIEEVPARPPAQGEVRLRVQAMLSSPATWRAGHAEARLTERAGPVPQASDQGGDRDARGH